jgi:hypothetical protein
VYLQIVKKPSRYIEDGLGGMDPFHWQNKIMAIYYKTNSPLLFIPKENLMKLESLQVFKNNLGKEEIKDFVEINANSFLTALPSEFANAELKTIDTANFVQQFPKVISDNYLSKNKKELLIFQRNNKKYLYFKFNN